MMDQGYTVWFTGLSGAGKTTLARMLEQRLRDAGARVELLDGDVVRTQLCKGLGFSKEDRDENVRRISFVAELLTRNGVITIVAAISPYRAARDAARALIGRVVEVHVDCSIDVLVARDPKGLYKRALAGEISHFTGISDPYEPPLAPEVVVRSDQESPEQSFERIWDALEQRGLVPVGRAAV